MVVVDVDDMLADGAHRHLVKLGQEPLVQPDGAVLHLHPNAGFSIFGLVEYDSCVWGRCAIFVAHVSLPLPGFLRVAPGLSWPVLRSGGCCILVRVHALPSHKHYAGLKCTAQHPTKSLPNAFLEGKTTTPHGPGRICQEGSVARGPGDQS